MRITDHWNTSLGSRQGEGGGGDVKKLANCYVKAGVRCKWWCATLPGPDYCLIITGSKTQPICDTNTTYYSTRFTGSNKFAICNLNVKCLKLKKIQKFFSINLNKKISRSNYTS